MSKYDMKTEFVATKPAAELRPATSVTTHKKIRSDTVEHIASKPLCPRMDRSKCWSPMCQSNRYACNGHPDDNEEELSGDVARDEEVVEWARKQS